MTWEGYGAFALHRFASLCAGGEERREVRRGEVGLGMEKLYSKRKEKVEELDAGKRNE